MGIKFYIDDKIYRIAKEESYVRVNGWAFDASGSPLSMTALLNGREAPCEVKWIKRGDVKRAYKKLSVGEKAGFCAKIPLSGGEEAHSLLLFARAGKKKRRLLRLGEKGLREIKEEGSFAARVESVAIFQDNLKDKLRIRGFLLFSKEGEAGFRVRLKGGGEIAARIVRMKRRDLLRAGITGEEDGRCGFEISFPFEKGGKYVLSLSDKSEKKEIEIDAGKIFRRQRLRERLGFIKKAAKHLRPGTAREAALYIKENGFRGLGAYMIQRVRNGKPYGEWFEEQRPSPEDLKKQGEEEFPYAPRISIIAPAYKTPLAYLRQMTASVLQQSYGNLELCIAYVKGEEEGEAERELRSLAQRDGRVKYKLLEENKGIAGNTNEALSLAEGEYTGLLDHDDILAPNALFEVVRALQEKRYDVLYTDEDKIAEGEGEHFYPNFKPDFNLDLLRSTNYICHFFVARTTLLRELGGLLGDYDGSQDYDLIFRCVEKSKAIKHIPKVLYHWRTHMDSVAENPESKLYAYEAGKRAIEAHLQRSGEEGTVEHIEDFRGMYHIRYKIKGEPLISILIPNKDHAEDLKKCLLSIYERSSYQNFEVIIVENNSEKEETFAFYKELENRFKGLRVAVWEEGFNYSAINNYGAGYAKGEYLLFLNNDTEMINAEAIEELLGYCQREEVGAVGARLYYPDDTIQHAGVVIGFGGCAGHVYAGLSRDDCGYMARERISGDYSAVTGACLMTKKSLFDELGGFDKELAVAYNDVDYCLRVCGAGKLVAYNAFSEWYHYESKSRGYEDTKEKKERFEREMQSFRKKWADILEKGDPFYNPNFSLNRWAELREGEAYGRV